MKIKAISHFKDEIRDREYFEHWVKQLEKANQRKYERIEVKTSLGITQVWGLNSADPKLETLVIFPGARTTALIWDFDRGLDNLNQKFRIYLVETNGLPNLSDGATPDIKSLDYGIWAKEVFEKLNIEKAFIAGASFGGLICMKFGITNPEKIKAAFLLNPGCLQFFSLGLTNLFYNILPILSPKPQHVLKFLEKAIFAKPNHQISPYAEKMLVDYEVFAISQYKDNTQKPYFMDKELSEVRVDTYLILGDKDLLFPFQKSLENAKKLIKPLKDIKVFQNVGHGVETYPMAMKYIGERIKEVS
jgi:pimeloyl-ACP methyl ester carboxylesterase